MKRLFSFICLTAGLFGAFYCYAADAATLELALSENYPSYKIAALHWLPDYQAKETSRVNDGGKKCSIDHKYTSDNCFGKYAPSGEACNDKYLNCTCKGEYQYDDTNCIDDKKPMGDTCDDKYNQCEYKTCTEAGYLDAPESGKTCNSIPYAGKTCYNCREMTCSEKCTSYDTNVSSCPAGQTKETCNGCSSFARCTGKLCPPGKTNCEYGCKTYSSQSGCSDVCTECKTCTPNTDCNSTNYPYLAADKPMNGIFEECTPGCGNTTVRYKMAQCMIGYIDRNSYWCTVPSSTLTCAALGYRGAGECGERQVMVRCPFDSTMIFCQQDETSTCGDKFYGTTTCPANATCVTCTEGQKNYQRTITCNANYVFNSTTWTCIDDRCPTGYARNAGDCGRTGYQGWTMSSYSTPSPAGNPCYSCVANTCSISEYPHTSCANRSCTACFPGDNTPRYKCNSSQVYIQSRCVYTVATNGTWNWSGPSACCSYPTGRGYDESCYSFLVNKSISAYPHSRAKDSCGTFIQVGQNIYYDYSS